MKIEEFEKLHNLNFKNKALLRQAFVHRSYINENPKSGFAHNERLEFLGDAVLELISTDFLYKKYSDYNEGELTAFRSALVNANTLGELAAALSFNDMIMLSKGEAKDTTRARFSILADAYEAFLGAVYLDQGYESAKLFVERTLLVKIEDVIKNGLYKDAKSFVQEKSQEIFGVTPSYKVLEEIGPDHDKRFTVAIFFGENKIAVGDGKSKQEGETIAAQNALKIKGWSK